MRIEMDPHGAELWRQSIELLSGFDAFDDLRRDLETASSRITETASGRSDEATFSVNLRFPQVKAMRAFAKRLERFGAVGGELGDYLE